MLIEPSQSVAVGALPGLPQNVSHVGAGVLTPELAANIQAAMTAFGIHHENPELDVSSVRDVQVRECLRAIRDGRLHLDAPALAFVNGQRGGPSFGGRGLSGNGCVSAPRMGGGGPLNSFVNRHAVEFSSDSDVDDLDDEGDLDDEEQ